MTRKSFATTYSHIDDSVKNVFFFKYMDLWKKLNFGFFDNVNISVIGLRQKSDVRGVIGCGQKDFISYEQGLDFYDMSSFFLCEIDDAIQYINLDMECRLQK